MNLHVRSHINRSYQYIDIDRIEKAFHATFVGDFCLKTTDGNWSEEPAAIFYAHDPDTSKGHTHYFGILRRDDSILITKGDSAFSEPIIGIIADDKEVIFSRYRHDYEVSLDQSVWIDGGRDYVRHGENKFGLVKLIIDKDQLIIDPESIPEGLA